MTTTNKKTTKQQRKYGLTFRLPSLTKQSEADACDINKILSKFEKTGQIQHINSKQPQFGDFTIVDDYQTSLNTIIHHQEYFDSLPAKTRAFFDNNALKFLEFSINPENQEILIKLGLIEDNRVNDDSQASPEAKGRTNESKPDSDLKKEKESHTDNPTKSDNQKKSNSD